MAKRKWTKEIIVERLTRWRAEGVPVKDLWRRDPAMTSRATFLFGSWRKALAAAGIDRRTEWSREVVIERLKLTRGRGLPVDAILVNAATRYFGTMRAACKAARVPCLTSNPPHLDWDRDMAVAAIRRRYDDGHSWATAREDPALYAAGKRLFETWTAARAAAGQVSNRRLPRRTTPDLRERSPATNGRRRNTAVPAMSRSQSKCGGLLVRHGARAALHAAAPHGAQIWRRRVGMASTGHPRPRVNFNRSMTTSRDHSCETAFDAAPRVPSPRPEQERRSRSHCRITPPKIFHWNTFGTPSRQPFNDDLLRPFRFSHLSTLRVFEDLFKDRRQLSWCSSKYTFTSALPSNCRT